MPSDDGHNYFFGSMPEMPWKKKRKESWLKRLMTKIRQLISIRFS